MGKNRGKGSPKQRTSPKRASPQKHAKPDEPTSSTMVASASAALPASATEAAHHANVTENTPNTAALPSKTSPALHDRESHSTRTEGSAAGQRTQRALYKLALSTAIYLPETLADYGLLLSSCGPLFHVSTFEAPAHVPPVAWWLPLQLALMFLPGLLQLTTFRTQLRDAGWCHRLLILLRLHPYFELAQAYQHPTYMTLHPFFLQSSPAAMDAISKGLPQLALSFLVRADLATSATLRGLRLAAALLPLAWTVTAWDLASHDARLQVMAVAPALDRRRLLLLLWRTLELALAVCTLALLQHLGLHLLAVSCLYLALSALALLGARAWPDTLAQSRLWPLLLFIFVDERLLPGGQYGAHHSGSIGKETARLALGGSRSLRTALKRATGLSGIGFGQALTPHKSMAQSKATQPLWLSRRYYLARGATVLVLACYLTLVASQSVQGARSYPQHLVLAATGLIVAQLGLYGQMHARFWKSDLGPRRPSVLMNEADRSPRATPARVTHALSASVTAELGQRIAASVRRDHARAPASFTTRRGAMLQESPPQPMVTPSKLQLSRRGDVAPSSSLVQSPAGKPSGLNTSLSASFMGGRSAAHRAAQPVPPLRPQFDSPTPLRQRHGNAIFADVTASPLFVHQRRRHDARC